ncbi:hypothetical protein ACO2Q8_23200 [Larkinella sp. VNQ87]|uniref:hypothetical protein n=1 Tax=Larkinella sp. VNQ87 TaxID=3400921 RepID=UPI003BFD8F5E
MKTAESSEEENGLPFRNLFSEDETRDFYRPVFQLPTRGIAIGSLVVSLLLAGALVISSRLEPRRPPKRPKPVPRSGKKAPEKAGSLPKTDTMAYFR